MKTSLKITLLFLGVLCWIYTGIQVTKGSKVFIMLNVDNTLLDRVVPGDETLLSALSKQGLICEKLQFEVSQKTSPQFIKLYEKISKGESLVDESDYVGRIAVKKIGDDKYQVTEYVVIRPSIRYLIGQLNTLGIPGNFTNFEE